MVLTVTNKREFPQSFILFLSCGLRQQVSSKHFSQPVD